VVPVYALCAEEAGEPWLVMRRIGGQSLADLLAASPPPRSRETVDRCLDIVLDVCDALRFAHSRGILHRDLKPENVMVGAFGEVLLLDWGIAARFGDAPAEVGAGAAVPGGTSVPHVSTLRQIAGTPRYMAPEQALGRGDLFGPWTDVYLLGGMLYEIVAGEPPHPGGTLIETLTAACRGDPPELVSDEPDELQAICRKALARDPGARYRAVAEFQAALREYLEHRESRALSRHAREGLERWRGEVADGVPIDERARRYAGAAEVIASFQHATLLWPDNEEARAGESEARRDWARLALGSGDLGVAETAIEGLGDEAAGIRESIARERAERSRTLRFARRLGVGLVVFQALLVAALAAFGFFELKRFTRAELVEQLERLERAVGAALAGADSLDPAALDAVADALGRAEDLRVELLALDAHRLAHSHGEERAASVLAGEPAVQSALAGGAGGVLEASGEIALARPWSSGGRHAGALLVALPRDALDGPLHTVLVAGLLALVVSFVLFSAVALRLSRRLAGSLRRAL
jgi:hypothetical protein